MESALSASRVSVIGPLIMHAPEPRISLAPPLARAEPPIAAATAFSKCVGSSVTPSHLTPKSAALTTSAKRIASVRLITAPAGVTDAPLTSPSKVVKLPAAGVVPPIAVPSIVPPVIVGLMTRVYFA